LLLFADPLHCRPVMPHTAHAHITNTKPTRPRLLPRFRSDNVELLRQESFVIRVNLPIVVLRSGSQDDRLPTKFPQMFGEESDPRGRRQTAGNKVSPYYQNFLHFRWRYFILMPLAGSRI